MPGRLRAGLSPQGRAYTRALKSERSLSPPIHVGDLLIQCRIDSSVSSVTGSRGIFFSVTNSRYFFGGHGT